VRRRGVFIVLVIHRHLLRSRVVQQDARWISVAFVVLRVISMMLGGFYGDAGISR